MSTQPMSLDAPRLGLLAVVALLHSACGMVPEEEVFEIEFVSGDGQIQGRERQLNEPVVVRAADEDGHPAPGVELSFSTDPPSGSVDFNSVTTDSIGRAAVWWTLGDLVGRQILTVRSQSLGAAISATARESDFDVHLVTDPGFTPEQVEAMRAGTERWTDVITGDMPDFRLPPDYRPPGRCLDAKTPTSGSIDDMRIEVRIRADLDSPMVLAFCEATESPVSLRPFWLYIQVTPSFVHRLHSESRLGEWMAHTTGHGLGYGLFWGSLLHNPVDEAGVGADTHFPDAATVAAFDAAGGAAWTEGTKVPVENAEENRDIHWRGDVLGHEIMSGWYTMGMPGDNPPLSAITVQAMAALGYEVDVSMADPYTLPATGAMAGWDVEPPGPGGWPFHGESTELIYDRGHIVGIVYR